jgi:hypothetical protein
MAQRPRAVDLYVCQRVIYEAGTSNVTVVNRFSQVFVQRLPATPDPFYAFALLNDGQGDLTAELVILRPDDLTEIYSVQGPLRLADPLSEGRCRALISGCTFPIEGAYHVSLIADQEPVATCRLTVILRKP